MMTIINEFQAGQHTEQAHEYCDLLWNLAQADKKTGLPSLASDRCASVDVLCESYYAQLGKMPDSNVLERLASLILFDELTDTHPDKMTLEEYPILSETQREERVKDEIATDFSEEEDNTNGSHSRLNTHLASDGRSYRNPIRRTRDIGELIKEDYVKSRKLNEKLR